MRTLANIRWQRRTWRICPWISVRSAVISLFVVAVTAVVFDRWILASLERRSFVASESWKRHNRVIDGNLNRKSRPVLEPKSRTANAADVRAWVGHEVSQERIKSHRLLVMGDSFVWGSAYLTLNHMWWRQLSIELRRRGYHDVEVIAAGRSGMSTHEELDLAKIVVPQFRPDLILWGFVTNDPDERMIKQINTSQLASPIPGRVQSLLRHVTPRLLDLFNTRRNDKLAKSYLGPDYGYEYSDWLRRIHDGDNFNRYRQTVSSVREFLTEVQIPGMMVTLPEAPIPSRFGYSYDKVLPLWRDAGIPVLDNLPALIQRFPDVEASGSRSLIWSINPADGHPGPRMTAFLASHTVDRLEQDYLPLLGPKSSTSVEIRINDWLPFNLDLKPQSKPGTFELTYPDTDEFLPTMPLEIPTVLVALEQPVPLRKIRLSGAGLKSARLWISTCDPVEAFDTEDWKDQGLVEGNDLSWTLPTDLSCREASVILFKADVQPTNRRLNLELEKTESQPQSKEGVQ
jgi:hypothetical protein